MIAFFVSFGASLVCFMTSLVLGRSEPATSTRIPEPVRSVGSFVDSLGVNIHQRYRDTGYGDAPAVAQLLTELGVRHVRDGIAMGHREICREDLQLSSRGIHFDYITQPSLTTADLATWAKCVGPAIEAFEGPNEYDISHPAGDKNWVATIQDFQKRLYTSVKGNRALKDVTVIGPSFTSGNAFNSVRDLSAYLDRGNMHNYAGGFNPGTHGWGLGGYGSIDYNIRLARAVAGEKPIVTTEIGYEANGLAAGLDGKTQAKYVPRMFLEQFNAGVARTFEYELIDDGGVPYDAFGLVARDLKPKPAFTALSSLLKSLQAVGADKHASPPVLSITNESSTIHHTLLEQNGILYVLLWIEVLSYDTRWHTAISVPTQYVHLRASGRPCSIALYTYDSNEELRLTSVQTANEARVPVTDSVEIVKFEAK